MKMVAGSIVVLAGVASGAAGLILIAIFPVDNVWVIVGGLIAVLQGGCYIYRGSQVFRMGLDDHNKKS